MIEDEATQHEVAVAYLSRGRKQITIDGVKARLPELYERFSAVSIGPEDSELLSGPPSARRLFMDLYISQYSKKYLESLGRYNRILAQKNAALKENHEFESFNALMVVQGSEIMRTRDEFIKMLNERAAQLYHRFSKGSAFELQYAPSAFEQTEWDEKFVESEFEKTLDEVKEKEVIMKSALVGPHRDEIRISINDFPARTHGSQGEWRSSAIALKLAVYNLLKEKRKFSPILLLDEVFAELDDERAKALVSSFDEFGQLFLTSAEGPPATLSPDAAKFKIREGKVETIP
jgi:DNA replication and repair protein RecF